jgi:hypothetical protein
LLCILEDEDVILERSPSGVETGEEGKEPTAEVPLEKWSDANFDAKLQANLEKRFQKLSPYYKIINLACGSIRAKFRARQFHTSSKVSIT